MIETISTTNAPQAIGPYSQACIAGGFLFASGQIPLDPQGNLVKGDIEEETRQVFRNVKAILEAAGAALEDVVKVTVFLKDMENFVRVNEIYASYFGGHKPARSTVEVSRLPKDVRIEIEVTALVPTNSQ